MLFHLYLLRAAVIDIPMSAVYGDEISNLSIRRALGGFAVKHIRNFARRLFFTYFLRDFSIASLHLVFGTVLLAFGVIFGSVKWYQSVAADTPASAGTVILAALPVLLGVQLILAFLSYDTMNQPRLALHTRLAWRPHAQRAESAAQSQDRLATVSKENI